LPVTSRLCILFSILQILWKQRKNISTQYRMEQIMNKDTKQNQNAASELAYAALDEIPTPKSDAKEIVGLVKSSGKVTGYQLSDGSTVSKDEGVSMAKSGDIQGVGVAHRKDSEYLKSLPDGTEENNLGNLPSISG